MAPVIRELSKSMINKIAAGEVIERPMNVVKELVENAIDAGATKIDVEVERSGVELIKVIDNGCGIAAEQLPLAITPHATSKISEPEDLFRIHTLGFRGEAMASIAEVSQFLVTSRAKDANEGAQLRCDGGIRGEVQPIGRAVGTTVEVRNLFFNLPARRKFLKSQSTEFGRIQDAFIYAALPTPGVAFTLKRNGRVVYDIPATAGMRERASILYGKDVADRLIYVESAYRDIKIDGWVGSPDLTRSTSSFQLLFLNGRFFRDRSLSHALAEAYRGLILSGRFPVAFINITVPADFVDVNVHPTKTELKFVDPQAVYAGLLGGLRDHFLRSDVTSRPNSTELAAAAKRSDPERETTEKKGAPDEPPKSARDESVKPDQSGASARSSQDDEEPRELRFVPDVDPSDPALAMDPALAENKMREARSWFAPKKENDVEDKTVEKKDEPRRDERTRVETARKDDRAASDERDDATRRSATRALMGKSDDFKKFPPLQGTSANRASSGSGFAPGSFGGRYETSGRSENEREERANENKDEERASANVFDAAKQDADADLAEAAFADLRERVAANNAGALDPKLPFSRQIARTSEGKPVMQICKRYLVLETKDGMAIVDQHALHERILFERLRANLEKGSVDAQRLLVPEVVDLAPSEFSVVLEDREVFAKLGLIVESFGGTSVIVNSYPAALRDVSATDIFLEALAVVRMKRGKTEFADLCDSALKQMACKAAVKAGDSLRPDAIVELIALAEEELRSHHCPHGRPSTLVFTCQEIDKLFKRL